MFNHEEYLKKAIEDCRITQLVGDLGSVYVEVVNKQCTDEEMEIALKIDRILKKAASDIASLGAKPKIPHPLDGKG